MVFRKEGFQVPGTFSPAFLIRRAIRELSIFVDESGSDGMTDRYYLLTIVMHDQALSLRDSIERYEQALACKGLQNIPFHASPLLNGKDSYAHLDLKTRKVLLGTFRVFFRHMPISYQTLLYKVREFDSLERLTSAMRRDLVNFFFDNLAWFQEFSAVKIYYDNGQHSIVDSLHQAAEYALCKDVIVYRSSKPDQYYLSQVADYICTVELTALKYAEHRSTSTDEKFFGKWSDFKKGVLKEVRKKRVGLAD